MSNNFYDEAHNDTFGMSRTESFWWDQGEPIWVTAERQGIKSATFFWPGSEVSARSRCRSDSRRYLATLVQFRARTNFLVVVVVVCVCATWPVVLERRLTRY